MTQHATRRRTLWQIALLSAGFLVLVAISVISIVLVNKARDDSRWVIHTVEVENQISTVLLDIRRAESAARGYLLTSQPKFLTEHEAAIQRILLGVDTLARQTSDSPSSDREQQATPRVRRIRQSCRLRERDDIPGGVAMLRDGSSTTVQRITEIATAMRAEEDRLFPGTDSRSRPQPDSRSGCHNSRFRPGAPFGWRFTFSRPAIDARA